MSGRAAREWAYPRPALPPPAARVHRRLRAAGEHSLLAGGAVRDHLLGRAAQDFDIATSARPQRVAEMFRRTVLTGARFGVVRVIEPDGEVEVVTFRSDLEYRDGRHPDGVAFSSDAEDARRRDFTINGLFYDLETGRVIDHVGGLDDLLRRRVSAIGDPHERFAEDRLRMLRAVRFAVTLGFAIAPPTWEALCGAAAAITAVSAERIRAELERILVHPRRELGFFLLSDSGLMAHILPEVEAMRGVAQPPQYHPEGDVHRHTALVLAQLRQPSFPLALGALLHDIGKPATFSIADRIRFHEHDSVGATLATGVCERLRLSRREREEVVYLVRRHLVFMNLAEMRVARRKRLFEEPFFPQLLALCRADCLGSHANTAICDHAEQLYREYLLAGPPVAPLLGGRDLLALGFCEGPKIGEILRAVEDARREELIRERDEALAWVRERYGGALEERR